MAFTDEMDKQQGSIPVDRIRITIGTVVTDLTSYYLGGAKFSHKKEKAIDRITTGDVTYTFSNYDNYFSELDSNSIFYNVDYLNNAKIDFAEGFNFSGSITYETQSTLKVIEVKLSQDNSKCYIRCQDPIQKILKSKINQYPPLLVPSAGTANTGNGIMSRVQTLPFSTVNRAYTVTFDSGTGYTLSSGTDTYGSGTVGSEFTATGNVCKFQIDAGGVACSNCSR